MVLALMVSRAPTQSGPGILKRRPCQDADGPPRIARTLLSASAIPTSPSLRPVQVPTRPLYAQLPPLAM